MLFVPIVGSFFPFHLDFVRGAGLLFALAGTLAAGPQLLRSGMASLRLVLPLGLAGSIASVAGALVGLSMGANLVQTILGAVVVVIAFVIWRSKPIDTGTVDPDALARWWGPRGFTTETEALDFRVGGTWKHVMQHD